MKDLNFKKHNVLKYGNNVPAMTNLMGGIFNEHFVDGDTVYFFDESFIGMECHSSGNVFGGPVRARVDNIDGIKSILMSVLVGGRTGLTLMVNYRQKVLEEAGLIDDLKEFCNSDNGCNLIMTWDSEEVPSGFNFGYKMHV